MNFIDKLNTPFAHMGVAETNQLLATRWNGSSYLNLSYEECKSSMGGLQNCLLKEQTDKDVGFPVCCYCMRKIDKNSVTLEHIVPNNISEKNWEDEKSQYTKYGNLDSNHITVCFDGNLVDKTKPITSLPYPHFISYHNLIASCDGKLIENGSVERSHCCNNMRGCLFVDPLYLNRGVDGIVGYDHKGNLDFDDAAIDSKNFDRKHLNLSSLGLCLVRRLWYMVTRTDYNVDDVIDAKINRNLRNDILDDAITGDTKKWQAFYVNEDVWNLFSDYSWFFYYYKRKYKT